MNDPLGRNPVGNHRLGGDRGRLGALPRSLHLLLSMVLLLMGTGALMACGGPAQATPTAIPADVVRPEQPTPVYPAVVGQFSVATPLASPEFVSTATPLPSSSTLAQAAEPQRSQLGALVVEQTPSAVGIAAAGATIYAEMGSRALFSLPVGAVITITGRSADGRWYAVYTDEAVYGWVPAGQLVVFGGDDLAVVDNAADPGMVATLIAEAMAPVSVLDTYMAQFEEGVPFSLPTTMPEIATQGFLPTPTALPLPAGIDTGVVNSEARLNLRQRPSTDAPILGKLEPGSQVQLVGRSVDNAWLQVNAGAMDGWVSAIYIELDRPLAELEAGPVGSFLLPTPTPLPTGELLPRFTGPVAGMVDSEARLNMRTEPTTDAAIVRKLEPETRVEVLGRTLNSAWLRISHEDFSGWVAAPFVRLNQPVDTLPVTGS